jgi:aminomethyltransferase
MSDNTDKILKRTPLNAWHRANGARMVSFGGWDMPVEYSSISNEHVAVRTRAGLFDVSHMGEIEIAGSQALEAVQRISCNDASRLKIGQAHYSGLMTPQGTFIDDLLVYRLAESHFLLVVNASNIEKDYKWILSQIQTVGDAVAVDASSRYALLALQGPAAMDILSPLTGVDLRAMKYYRFEAGEVAGVRATVSRTGYTGEDGVEILLPSNNAERAWKEILIAGEGAGLIPAGLGARDTLRLEAAMRLYGNDIDETTSVLEAGLGWIIGWKKEDFIGLESLRQEKVKGVTRKIVGFEMLERGIARQGYDAYLDGKSVGRVRSGTQTPFLKKAIGMIYLPTEQTAPGTEFEIEIRSKKTRAKVVSLPFYERVRS